MFALGTRMILRSRQRRIADHVRHDVGDLVHLVHDLVDVDAVVVGQLFVVAVSAGVHQHFVLLVLLGVEHVVALLAESDAHESGTFAVAHLARVRSVHLDKTGFVLFYPVLLASVSAAQGLPRGLIYES